MSWSERGGEGGGEEGGVLDGGEDTKVGEGTDDEEEDDGLDWTEDSAPGERQKRDAHDEADEQGRDSFHFLMQQIG